MTQQEADALVNQIMIGVQKVRSNMLEFNSEPNTDLLFELQPWLFGEKSLLIVLERLTHRIDQGGHVEPLELYNLLFVVHRWVPAVVLHGIATESPVPEADEQWMIDGFGEQA